MMTHIDLVGYLAAGLVLLTFQMKSMNALRLTSVVSSLAFITYALLADLTPVLVLHSILMLTNLYRLREMSKDGLGQWGVGYRSFRLVIATVVFVALVLIGKPISADEKPLISREEAGGTSVVMDAVSCTADLLVCSSIIPQKAFFETIEDCQNATEELKQLQLVRANSLKPVVFARCRFMLMRSVSAP